MKETYDPNGIGKPSGEELLALLNSAAELRDRAKTRGLDFVAYLANMTVLEISHQLARRTGTD